MAASELWSMIHAERQALADDLASLSEAQWATPSLCSGWTVHDMLAHMLATAKMTPGKFFTKLAGAGFSFDAMANKDVQAEGAGGPANTLAEYRRHLGATTKPPGPADAMLGDAVIHAEDIRRPLGIKHDYPAEAVVRCLDFLKRSNLLIGSKRRISGLTLRATDTDWSTGNGPEVSGPVISLLLAMTGRSAGLDDLSGTGLDTLRSRMP
jgi:uncharacterized protein (TIGR03083 family)